VFAALARSFPDAPFAAVPTWGTTPADRAELAALPNVTLLDPVENIDDVLRLTRVLLVPSLWAEARSRLILEGMSRGVPVLASDVGGLREAALGVDCLLPVTPVTRYQPAVDELMVPVAEIPPQDTAPWTAALGRLLTDPAHYLARAAESRRAALEYLERLTALPFEAYLEERLRVPRSRPALGAHTRGAAGDRKRQLLAQRLRRRPAGG
jgi:glycosyltransferase involved in cell wall biosynthesis